MTPMSAERQCIIIADDDPLVTAALSAILARDGRTIIVCSDIESAEMMLAQREVTHLVTDVQFSGAFGFEGLHFLAKARARMPRGRIVLMTGYVTDALSDAARGFGANAVLSKPFDSEELERALGDGPHDLAPAEVIHVPSIDEILQTDEITSAFQPIVRLTANGAEPFGFEALTRVRGEWLPGGPASLFDYAGRRERLAELNMHALERAMASASALPGAPLLFINVDPIAFDGGLLVHALKKNARAIPLDRIVLEITERSAFSDDAAAGRTCAELREAGVRFALDDHGSAYSHLSVIDRIKPSFIKISLTFGLGLEGEPAKQAIVRNIVSLARDFACETILEGIETAATARAAIDAGVQLAQGYYFGRPSAAAQWKNALQAA